MRRALGVLALALGAALWAVAQETPPPSTPPLQGGGGTTEDRRRALAARVARARGKALVQQPGEGGWVAVGEDALIQAGDRVRADDGPVELTVPSGEAALQQRGVAGGDRVVLAPDARVTLSPPGTDARVRLDEGEVFASGTDGLRVQAGDTTITVRGGDAALEVSRTGDVTVTVHSGRVDLDPRAGGGGGRALAENERITLDARGERVTRTRPKVPGYVTEVQDTIGKLVCPPFLFKEWPGTFLTETHGVRAPEGHVTSHDKGPNDEDYLQDPRVEVRIGRWAENDPKCQGLWRVEPGTRVRMRYRLHAPAPLQLDVAAGGLRFESEPLPGRVGAWDDIEFRLEELEPRRSDPDRTPRIQVGWAVTYLSLYAGAPDQPRPPGQRLDVSRIIVFTPKRR